MMARRMIEKVRKQDWTTVTVEFVLLVIGVFLGIQAANWNAERADERLARAYVQRLTTDLRTDLATRREMVAYYTTVLDSVERTDALLADPESDPRALLVNAYRATEYNYATQTRATWDEIVSGGHADLLPPGVAAATGEYFAFDSVIRYLDVLMHSAYRQRVRMLIPIPLQKALRAGCSDAGAGVQTVDGFAADCVLDVDPALIAAAADTLRADLAVRETLRYQYSDVDAARANIAIDATAAERVLAAIADGPSAEAPSAR